MVYLAGLFTGLLIGYLMRPKQRALDPEAVEILRWIGSVSEDAEMSKRARAVLFNMGAERP